MRDKLIYIQYIGGLLILLCGTAVHAAYDVSDLKKLFTDKSQRARIDAMRTGRLITGEIRQSTKINVNGYVIRSDGKNVVWINSKNTLDSNKLGDIKVYPSSVGKNKTVTVNVEGKIKHLKPGETWYKNTDKVVDSK